MLEGTKHEKAVLVVLAYIIGLTSGFIGFGVNNYYQDNLKSDKLETKQQAPQSAPVLGTSDQAGYVPPTEHPPEEEGFSESVVYIDGQLTALTDEGHMVLSVHIDKLGEVIPEPLEIQGHHTQPPIYLASPEGKYVYFCEQHLGEDSCTNLLFDAEAVSIQYLQVEDKKFVTPVSQAATAYWAVDGLHIGEFISESISSPWRLIQKTE